VTEFDTELAHGNLSSGGVPSDSSAGKKSNGDPGTVSNSFSIFILKIKPDSLKQAQAFLVNRGWTVGSGTSLREAMAYMIQKKPEFILIAADHPNKKVKLLPKLLAQAFSVKIVTFAESQSGHAISSLHEMGAEYTLFPPVSGPSIERIVLKMKLDEEKVAEEKKQRIARGDTNLADSGVVRLKGESGSEQDANNIFEQARAALNQLISNDQDDQQEGGTFVDKGQSVDMKSSGLGQPGPTGGRASHDQGPREGESFAQWEERTRTAPPAGMAPTQGEDPPGSQSHQGGFDDTSDWSGLEKGTGMGTSLRTDAPQPGHSAKPLAVIDTGHAPKKPKLMPRYKRGDWDKNPDSDSIIIKGTQAALEETVIVRDDIDDYTEIDKASHCACIIVESERFSGYLVAALGKNRKVDRSFIEQVKNRLFSFLKIHGEIVKEEDSMNVKIEEVAFEDWALEQAEFLRKSIHDGDEVAMAFFPTKDTATKLEQSVSEKMLMMEISELKEDTTVEFDLYIYMPQNNKYLLYTPQGKTLYSRQHKRLTDNGVTHMHLRKDSVHNLKKYRAQNYLNEKIEVFKAKNSKR
jgi:hypothetical protein